MASMNVQSLNNKVNDTLHLFDSRHLDLLLIQETCLDRESLDAIARMAKKRKVKFHAANPKIRSDGRSYGGLACFSKWPVQPVRLKCYDDPQVASTVQALRLHRANDVPFLLVNVHFQSGNEEIAQNQFETVLTELLSLNVPAILFGDWNLTPQHSSVAFYEARGILHLGGTGVFPTRTSGKCIDFAASVSRCPFHYETQYSGLADHEVVQIHIPDIPLRETFHHAKRRPLEVNSVLQDRWDSVWNMTRQQFLAFLHDGQIDSAWQLLSGAFEQVLSTKEHDNKYVLRHQIPTPRPENPYSQKSIFPESFRLRRLKRYIRRVQEFHRHPSGTLFKKITATQTYLLKLWPQLSEPGVLMNPDSLRTWAAQIESETRSANKKAALARIECSDSRAYQWLKRPASTDAPRETDDPVPIAPEEQVKFYKQKWERLWLKLPETNFEFLEEALGNHASFPPVQIEHVELYKLAQKAKSKAAGPDGWKGCHFAALPEIAFEPLVQLWNACVDLGQLPGSWCEARTVFIDKPDGDKRPLSIASLCWRLCGSAVLKKLTPWINLWIHKDLCGGLPGTRADSMHIRLSPELVRNNHENSAKVIGVKQDLAKCFDATCSSQAIAILSKFGLPAQLGRILTFFYRNHTRWLEIEGCVSLEPVKPTRSILQGCPFSVLLLSGIMSLWATQMQLQFPQLHLGVFIDDRTLWMKNQPVKVLQQVVNHSNALDARFGFQSNKAKEAFFANTAYLRKKLKTLGNTYSWFTLLGIHYQRKTFCAAHTSTVAKHLDLMLSRIRFLFKSRNRRRVFVQMLIIPTITWAAAWSTYSKKFLQQITGKIERCILGRITPGRSPTLIWALLGLNVNPRFQQFVVAFRVWEWQIWKHVHGGPPPFLSLAARETFDNLSWEPSPDGIIETPNGRLTLGIDSHSSILQLAKLAFFSHLWKRDKRVSPEERTKWPDLQILTETSKTLDCLTWSFESAITGAAVDGRMTACFEKRTVNCRCGETNPTRRHLLWRCQAYSSARQRFGLAQFPELATAEEGLLVKSVDKPVFLNQICQVTLSELVTGGELDRIRNLVHDMANNSKTKSGPIVIGTDGSTHRHMYITKGAAAFATQKSAVAFTLKGWDQTSPCAEAWAVCVCILSLCKFLPQGPSPVILLCDNLDVVQKLNFLFARHPKHVPCWPHWALFSAIYRNLQQRPDIHIRPIWIPSHGKAKPWDCPSELDETFCRAINAAADAAAADRNESSFSFCQRLLVAANLRKDWMVTALKFLQHAIADFQKFDTDTANPA